MDKKENPCDQCPEDLRGKCCYMEATIKGNRVVTDKACIFLNRKNGKCWIYPLRRILGNCASVGDMIKKGLAPKRCLYVLDNKEYQDREDVKHYDYEITLKDVN